MSEQSCCHCQPNCCCQSLVAKIGKPALNFKARCVLPSLEFVYCELSQFKGKWQVLFPYPADFSFVCPTEIITFSDEYEKFKKINCEIVGLSTDSVLSHLAWICVPF